MKMHGIQSLWRVALAGALAGLTLAGAPALACEEFVRLEDSDAAKLFSVLEDAASKDIDRLFAVKKLVCSNDPNIRRFAAESGLASKNPIIRRAAFASLLFEKKSLVVHVNPPGDLSEQEKNHVRSSGQTITLPFVKISQTQNCIVFQNSDCGSDNVGKIEGTKVVIDFRNMTIELSLAESQKLVGFVVLNGGKRKIPVTADLL